MNIQKLSDSAFFSFSKEITGADLNLFDSLPDELAGKIFNLIPGTDYSKLKWVSKKFKKISEIYLERISLTKFDRTLHVKYPNLQIIHLKNRKEISNMENAQLCSFKKLTALMIDNPKTLTSLNEGLNEKVSSLTFVLKTQYWAFAEEINKFVNLRNLVFRHSKVSTMNIGLWHLRCLEFDSVEGFNNQMFASIVNLPQLEVLNLAKKRISEPTELNTDNLTHLSKLQRLTLLCLDNMVIPEGMIKSLCTLKHLRILSLTNCQYLLYSKISALFDQNIELLDFSNSIPTCHRSFLNSIALVMPQFNHLSLDVGGCGSYENEKLEIFQKIENSLSNDLLLDAMRHIKFKAPLVLLKEGVKGEFRERYRKAAIQGAPFFSGLRDRAIFNDRDQALTLLATPLPAPAEYFSGDCGPGVGSLVSQCSDQLRDDVEIIAAAIDDGTPSSLGNIVFATSRLRSDYQSMLRLCKVNINALRYAHLQIQKKLYAELATSARRSLGYKFSASRARNFFPELTLDLASAIVEYDGMDLRYLSPHFQNRRDIVSSAILNNPKAIELASNAVDDIDFMRSILQRCERALFYLSDDLQRYYLQLFAGMSQLIANADLSIQRDREFCLALVKRNSAAFAYLSHEFRDDDEIANIAVNNFPQMSAYISPRLKGNFDFACKALAVDWLGD